MKMKKEYQCTVVMLSYIQINEMLPIAYYVEIVHGEGPGGLTTARGQCN